MVIYHCGNISHGAPSVAINARARNSLCSNASTIVDSIKGVTQIEAFDHDYTCVNLINAILVFVPFPSCKIIRMNILEVISRRALLKFNARLVFIEALNFLEEFTIIKLVLYILIVAYNPS